MVTVLTDSPRLLTGSSPPYRHTSGVVLTARRSYRLHSTQLVWYSLYKGATASTIAPSSLYAQLVVGTLLRCLFRGLCKNKEDAAAYDVWNRTPG